MPTPARHRFDDGEPVEQAVSRPEESPDAEGGQVRDDPIRPSRCAKTEAISEPACGSAAEGQPKAFVLVAGADSTGGVHHVAETAEERACEGHPCRPAIRDVHRDTGEGRDPQVHALRLNLLNCPVLGPPTQAGIGLPPNGVCGSGNRAFSAPRSHAATQPRSHAATQPRSHAATQLSSALAVRLDAL